MARRVTLVGADMLLVYYLRPVEFQLAFQLADMSHILLLSLLLLQDGAAVGLAGAQTEPT